jgi:hypothetical protein
MLAMCEGPVVDNYRGLEPLDTMINLPGGVIEPRTSAGRSIKGSPSQFVVLDQTEEWVASNGGPDFADKIRDNVAKVAARRSSRRTLSPRRRFGRRGSAAYAQSIVEGRALNDGLLYDHREAPPETDMYERESLTLGLRVAYGDSSGHPDGCVIHDPPCPPGHVDLESAISEDLGVRLRPQESVGLPEPDHPRGELVDRPADLGRPVSRAGRSAGARDRRRRRHHARLRRVPRPVQGQADATALIGCRVVDGHLFEVGVWEADDDKTSGRWTPPIVEIEAAIARCFDRYKVAAFYCDPAKDWRSYVNAWEARYAKPTCPHPDRQAGQGHPRASVRVVDDRRPVRPDPAGDRAARGRDPQRRHDP